MQIHKITTKLFIFIAGAIATNAEAKVYEAGGERFQFEVLTKQKDVIWGFDFLDSKRVIFTERGGKLKLLDLESKKITEIAGVPPVFASGQGGLLDIRVHPTQKSKIYLTYAQPVGEGSTTALATATLSGTSLTAVKQIFSAIAPSDTKIHYGSRIEFDNKGHVYISVGDRNQRDRVQDLAYHNGKVIRLNEDGSVPTDNPFVKNPKARPEVWSYGHRSPQGLVRNAITGDLWLSEMGPRGGDELNLIRAGANYGWPVITYGREYYGLKIGEGPAKAGMEQPVVHWVPSISPSALTIYTGTLFPKWKDHLFLANLSGTHLRLLKLKGQTVVAQEELLKEFNLRIRNVRTGPEGDLFISTDSGQIARLKK